MARPPANPPVAQNDIDVPFFTPPPPAADAEWGKAALATGGVLLVAGFPGILLITVLATNWNRLIAASDTDLTAAFGYVGYTLGLLTAVFAVVSAVRSWVGAARHGRTAAWAVHGVLIGSIATIVWGIALFSWFKCIEDVERQQRQPPIRFEVPLPRR